MVYLTVFLTSIVFCYAGETLARRDMRRHRHGNAAWFFFAVAVGILVVLAGCRDYTIGTDIRYYGNQYFYAAIKENSFFDYFSKYKSILEPGYLLLNFVLSRITSSPHWLYAVIGLVIYLCAFIGIYRFRDRISITFAWTLFILMFYAFSFNGMRQMMAMMIFFMGSVHLFNRKYARLIPYVAVGTLFHQTLLVFAIAFVAIMVASTKIEKREFRIVVIAGALLLVAGYVPLLQLFISLGILAEKMSRYVLKASGPISINSFLQRIVPIVIFGVLTKKKGGRTDYTGNYLILMMVLDLILVTLGIYSTSMTRVALYFSMFHIYGYPYFLKKIGSRSNRRIVSAVLLVMFTGIWIYQMVYRGNNEIYPYTSEILGIR